jgi:hypothetical protein
MEATMTAIENYFNNIVNDLVYLAQTPNMDKEIAESRVTSLFLRVVGGLFALTALSTLAVNVATFPVSPVTSLAGIASALLIGAIAYDLIVMGDNMRRINNACDGAHLQGRGIFGQLFAVGRSILDVAQAGVYEAQNDLPYVFRGTILLDPLVRILRA